MARILAVTSLLLVLMSVLVWCLQPSWFAIDKIEIEGGVVSEQELRERLKGIMGEDLLHLQEHSVYELLDDYSWIDQLTIQKHFPHKLSISVSAKEPIAIWQGRLVDAHGRIFELPGSPQSLVILHASEKDLPLVAKRCRVWQTRLREVSIKSCDYRDRQWSLVLSSGLQVLFGSELMSQRMQRFLSMLDADDAVLNWKQVDMRYPHGVSIKR